MKTKLDMKRIARGLGAERVGRVAATGGHFGALQLAAEIQARFRAPAGGGRVTNPGWTTRRLVPLAPRTLKRLRALTAKIHAHGGLKVGPMQLAGLLLSHSTDQLSEAEAKALVGAAHARP